VEVYLVDYRGRRLKRKDRHPDDDFSPEEKCVDIALASSMLYFAALPLAYDIAIVIGGDRDYVPVLQKVRLLGKRVALASIHGACSYELMEGKNLKGVRDFDVIWLQDILDDIRLVAEERPLRCMSPFHKGPNPVMSDEFVRKNRPFYCKDCRERIRNERSSYLESSAEEEEYHYQEAQQLRGGPAQPQEAISNMHTGDSYTGTVKRLMEFCGFIETAHGDYYFGMDDCAPGTDFFKLDRGARVEFIISKLPNRQVRGSQGNGNAEEVSLVETY
jgi:hypothetical protein